MALEPMSTAAILIENWIAKKVKKIAFPQNLDKPIKNLQSNKAVTLLSQICSTN